MQTVWVYARSPESESAFEKFPSNLMHFKVGNMFIENTSSPRGAESGTYPTSNSLPCDFAWPMRTLHSPATMINRTHVCSVSQLCLTPCDPMDYRLQSTGTG